MPVIKYVCIRPCYHRRKRYNVGDPYTPLPNETEANIPKHFERKDVYEERTAREETEAEQAALSEALGEELDLNGAKTFAEIQEKQLAAEKAALPDDSVI